MCVPAVAAAALIAGATQAVSVVAQNQIASAQNRSIREQHATRQRQIDQAATDEINARLREQRREASRISVAAGEAGLSLTSGGVEALLMDSVMQAELANDTSLANRESRKAAATADANAAMQSKTTLLGAGLRIGLSAGGAYAGARGSSPSP